MKIDKLNRLLADRLGRHRFGGPLYKWVQAHELKHYRYVGDDFVPVSKQTGLVAPKPRFVEVEAYPHLGRRWVFAVWQHSEEKHWNSEFGSRVLFHRHGQYFPVMVMREGKKPDLDITEFFVQQVRAERSKSATQFEREMEEAVAREDRAAWNQIYNIIDDATTAFGNDPGKRSGGVSFPSKEFTHNAEKVWQESHR